jgi:hypothetical protein
MQDIVNAYLVSGKVSNLHDRCRRFVDRMLKQYRRFLDRLLERDREGDEIQSGQISIRYRGNRTSQRLHTSKQVRI